jgi:tetratricopeptide (TPR) repeat protein
MSLRQRLFDDSRDDDLPDGQYPDGAVQDDDREIAFTDSHGQIVRVTMATFRDQVLPARVHNAWDEPDALHAAIAWGVAEGCADMLQDASERLRDIDLDVQRSLCLHAFVLVETARASEAEHYLLRYLDDHRPSARVLLTLADAYWAQGKHPQAERTLRDTLVIDPENDGARWRLDEFFGRAA